MGECIIGKWASGRVYHSNSTFLLSKYHILHSSQKNYNFLGGLPGEDYKMLRGLIVEMVLATDMSSHFDQVLHMRYVMSHPEEA